MNLALEDLLPGLRDSARGEPRAPQAVYQRLKFLARVLQAGAIGDGRGALLLWLDHRGEVRSQPISGTGVIIGREPASDVVLAEPRVSRRHCVVRLRTDAKGGATGAEIEDLGSANGTVVNGAPLSEGARGLHDGDVIEVGGVALAVVIDPRKG